MSYVKKREIAVGIAFLLVGLGYLYLTAMIPRKQFIDAAFVPYVLATIMCVLGVLQLLEVRKISDSASSQAQDTSDYRTVWKTLGLIVAYAALMEPVGFPVMTVVYLFAQFIVLTPLDKKVNYPMYLIIAVLTSIIVISRVRIRNAGMKVIIAYVAIAHIALPISRSRNEGRARNPPIS